MKKIALIVGLLAFGACEKRAQETAAPTTTEEAGEAAEAAQAPAEAPAAPEAPAAQ